MKYKRGAELRIKFKHLKDKFINDLSELESEIVQSNENASNDDEFNINQLYIAIREVNSIKHIITNYYDEIQRIYVADTIISGNFTKSEREVFKLIIKGYTASEIAEILNISHKTVETHARNMLKKICDDDMFSDVIRNSERFKEFENAEYKDGADLQFKYPTKLLRYLYEIVIEN